VKLYLQYLIHGDSLHGSNTIHSAHIRTSSFQVLLQRINVGKQLVSQEVFKFESNNFVHESFCPLCRKKEKKDEDISESGLLFVQDMTVSDDSEG